MRGPARGGAFWLAVLLALAACDGGDVERGASRILSRAEALGERAASFDPRRALAALPPDPRNGPSFRFDQHLEAARMTGRPIPPPPVPAFGFEFEGDDPMGFGESHPRRSVRDGVLRIEGAAKQALSNAEPLDLDPTDYAEVELRIRLARGSAFELAWSRAHGSAGRLRVDAADDGEFHVYRIDARTALRRRVPPGERIRSFVLQPSNRGDDVVELDYLRFVPKGTEYAEEPFGSAYEARGDELRPVLYSGTPLALGWEVEVPVAAPHLAFGMGVLDADDPVRFAVRLRDGGEERELFSARVDDPERWRDAELDLSEWAGRRVELVFATESAAGNIAFWSNPVLFGAPRERLNVILLLEDTLRADHLASYGHFRETSPTKDRLAARGVVFEHAFSQAPTTRPSLPSLMTSLYPSATGVWTHEQMLDDRYLTLAEILRHQGFATASFVQNSNAGRSSGLHQGFGALFERPTTEGNENVYAGPAAAWLERNRHRNFFLYLHVIDPHGVYDPPEPWDAWYRELGSGGTPVRRNAKSFDAEKVRDPTLESRQALYDGEIRHNDAWLERLVAQLEALDLLDSTLFVFVSDHGEHFGEHERVGQPLDGHHAPGYAQVLRVPLILVHPKLLPARRIEAPVQLVDVVPTVLDLLGIDTRDLLTQGDSLLPLIRGEAPDWWRDRIALSEEPDAWRGRSDARISASAFYDRWHLLHSRTRPGPELYDYRADPQEQQPVAGRERERQVLEQVLVDMKAANVAIWEGMTRDADGEIRYDPDALEQLRELGYIE